MENKETNQSKNVKKSEKKSNTENCLRPFFTSYLSQKYYGRCVSVEYLGEVE